MSLFKHHQHWICLGLMTALFYLNCPAQENSSNTHAEAINAIEAPPLWLNLPQVVPLDKDSVYGTVGIIRTEYQPVSKFDKIITYLTRKTGLSSEYDLRTGFVGFNDKMVITSSNILLDNQGLYLHNTYTWHPQYSDTTPPEATQGIPLRNFIILSQHKGYAEGLDDAQTSQTNFAIAIAAEKLSENPLPTINFERNQKLFWSNAPKGIVGYHAEMYSDILKTPESFDQFRLHQSALTLAPTQPTTLYAMEYWDCENCHALNQPFIYSFSSTVGSPVYIQTSDRGFIICGLVVNTTEPKIENNIPSGKTYIHYFTPQDKDLLDNYHPHLQSSTDIPDSEPPQVESLQSSQVVQYQSVRNVHIERDQQLLQPHLTWEGIDHTTDYVIFRTETPLLSGKPEEFIASVTDTQFADTNTDIFKTYYYWVCAHYTEPHELLTYPSGPHKALATPTPEAPILEASQKTAYEFSWTALPYGKDLVSYKVHRKTIDSSEDPIITETIEPIFTDTTANTSKQYIYWVSSQLYTLESQPSNEIFVNIIPPPANAPQNIRAHPWIANQLTWDTLTEPYITYFVYGATSNDVRNIEFINKTQDNFLSIDPSVSDTYTFFTVFAQNPTAIGPFAGTLTELHFQSSTLEAPQNLQVSNPLKRRISWQLTPHTYVKEFTIYRREKNSSEPATVVAQIHDNVFEDTSAEKNKTYIYQVQAFNTHHQSPLSNELEVCFDCFE